MFRRKKQNAGYSGGERFATSVIVIILAVTITVSIIIWGGL